MAVEHQVVNHKGDNDGTKKIAIFAVCHACGVPRLLGADTQQEADALMADNICEDCKKDMLQENAQREIVAGRP